jgi:molecular chaperone DnaJ
VRFSTSGGSASPDLEDLLGGMFGSGGPGYGQYGAPAGPRKGADINATTKLSLREAVNGSTVTLRGPDGTPITARIPAGVRDGQKIRLRGKGSPGEAGRGDLLITVAITPHPVFTRTGDDLALTLPISFDEAALGAQVEVPTLDGSVQMKIPAGTPSGRVLRLKGRGVTNGATDRRPAGHRPDRGAPAAGRRGAGGGRGLRQGHRGTDPRADLRARARS